MNFIYVLYSYLIENSQMHRQLLNCQSNWHWAKGTKIDTELRSDVLKIDVSQKIRKIVNVTLVKTRDLIGL